MISLAAGKTGDNLIVRIDGDFIELEHAMGEAESKARKSVSKIGGELTSINKFAKKVATGIGVIGAAAVGLGVKYNAEMEQYKAGFTTMLGSAEQADKTIASLKSFAEKTPFELTDLANASTTLLAFGEDVNNLEADLKMLGDISLGNVEKFRGLALVFGQVQSQGKLMGQDLLQMINQGFNPLQIISEKTGESMASLKDKMSKGQISFEMVADAMKTATSEGGQFFNAMEAQSKTFTGQVSTLKDNVVSLFGEMSEDISQNLTESVLPKAIEMVEDLKEAWADGSLQKQIKGAAVALTVFGGAVVGVNVGLFVNDMVQLVKGTKDFTTATKLGTTAQKLFNAELLKNPYTWVAVALGALVSGVAVYAATHKSAAKEIKDSIKDLRDSHEDAIKSIDKNTSSLIAEAEVAKTLKSSLYDLEEQLKSGMLSQEEATEVQENFKITAGKLEEIIPGITSSLYDETGAIDVQKGSVDALVDSYYDLAVAKAMVTAYEEKIAETARSLADAKENQREAKENEQATLQKYKTALTPTGRFFAGIEHDRAEGALESAKEEVQKYETELGKLKEGFVETQKTLSNLMGDVKNEDGDKIVTTAKKTAKEVTDTLTEEQERQLQGLDNSYRKGEISTKDYYKSLKAFRDEHLTQGSDMWEDFTETLEKLRDLNLADLEYAHDIGEKDDEEYYKALAEHRDTYFETGSDEWRQYTLDIYNWQKSVLNKVKEDSIAAVEEFNKAKEDIVSGLDDDVADTYQTVTILNGDNPLSYTKLADVGAENKKLDEYNEMLDKLFERTGGELPDYVMQQLKSMNVDEGINYMSAMLRASDSEFEAYINGLEEKAEKQSLVADKLMTEEAEKLTSKLTEIYGTIPEGFFDIGEDSATEFAEGFGAQLATELKNIMDNMVLNLNSFASPILSGMASGNQYVNSYYNNYYLQPSGESVYAQRKAIEDQNTYNSMIGEG